MSEALAARLPTSFAVQLRGTGPGSQLNSGTTVGNDAENQLFLVAQPFSSISHGSTIYVRDEKEISSKVLTASPFPSSFGSFRTDPKRRSVFHGGRRSRE
ncbi:MAG: hypothetical protein WBW76_03620 [Candidatus Cybelea sp.]